MPDSSEFEVGHLRADKQSSPGFDQSPQRLGCKHDRRSAHIERPRAKAPAALRYPSRVALNDVHHRLRNFQFTGGKHAICCRDGLAHLLRAGADLKTSIFGEARPSSFTRLQTAGRIDVVTNAAPTQTAGAMRFRLTNRKAVPIGSL